MNEVDSAERESGSTEFLWSSISLVSLALMFING